MYIQSVFDFLYVAWHIGNGNNVFFWVFAPSTETLLSVSNKYFESNEGISVGVIKGMWPPQYSKISVLGVLPVIIFPNLLFSYCWFMASFSTENLIFLQSQIDLPSRIASGYSA